jgi:hypothetical protein
MGILDDVVRALRSGWVSGEATGLAKPIKFGRTAGQDLVHVRLVSGVPQNRVLG